MDRTGVSRTTLRKYLKKFKESDLTLEALLNMNDMELDSMFLASSSVAKPSPKVQTLQAILPAVEKELKKPGVTVERMWREYKANHPDGFKLSQFRHYLRLWKSQSSVTMHIEHKAGDKLYVDFSGDKLAFTDTLSGVIHQVEVFVSILGASQLIYVEAVMSQKKEDFITACRNALHYYGGSPDAIVPDNLRAAVTQSHRYEPEINKSFEDFAAYYGMSVVPARAYKPRDKALVEGAVKIVYMSIFAELRSHVFTSLSELNEAIWTEMEKLNSSHFKGRNYSRQDLFDEIERDCLAPLPRLPYEIRTESRATVMKNGHVALNLDRHYYSVPYGFIGCKVKIMASAVRVDIYHMHTCIASHERVRRHYGYTTNPDHLASTHKAMSEWSAAVFLKKAEEIGSSVQLYIQRVFELRQHPEQAFRTCQGILSFARRIGADRLDRACARALDYGLYNYRTIKLILERGLDSCDEDQESTSGNIPDHDNIRGTEYYKGLGRDTDSDTDRDVDGEPGEEEALV